MITVRPAQMGDAAALIALIGGFRAALAELRGGGSTPDPAACQIELDEYIGRNFPIFVAEQTDGGLAGYCVCRVNDDVLWVESLFVRPEYRRQGIASALYARAEQLAGERGGNPPYNWVDPTNAVMIAFLRKRGYSVLNLIELRKPYPNEKPGATIRVGSFEFDR